jgi:hypothetical protein
MLKQTLIIASVVLATALILSGVSVAGNDARGHGLVTAQDAASKHGITHGLQGLCNAAEHQNITTLNGCFVPPPPTEEPPPPPTEEPPPPICEGC